MVKKVFESGDRFWTACYAYYLEFECFEFRNDENQSTLFDRCSKFQPLSDYSVFNPSNFPLSILLDKFL
jgi:hypothetical protein